MVNAVKVNGAGSDFIPAAFHPEMYTPENQLNIDPGTLLSG
jgi:hypothetical protein